MERRWRLSKKSPPWRGRLDEPAVHASKSIPSGQAPEAAGASRLRLAREEEEEAKGAPMPHPFIIQSIIVRSASGDEKWIDHRAWADYGLKR